MRITECFDLPQICDHSVIYRLLPKNPNDTYYWERVDRNLGWLTRPEQEILRSSVVSIAGCGGMGAAVAERLLRAGVGEIRIADQETFDVSNINRQLAATRIAVGQNKAVATARALRNITDDANIMVYPQGINDATAHLFVENSHVICDEIEFWELSPAILLHQKARQEGVTIFGCNTAGFGSHLFMFTPDSLPIEEAFGITLKRAGVIDQARQNGMLGEEGKKKLLEMLLRVVTPALTEYCLSDPRANLEAVIRRLTQENKASILGTNAAFATGFVADRILLYLLRNSGVVRSIAEIPPFPGYAYLDAAKVESWFGEVEYARPNT